MKCIMKRGLGVNGYLVADELDFGPREEMAAEMCSTCGGPADSAKVGSGIPPLGSGRILRLGAAADDGVGCIVLDTSQNLRRGYWNGG
jgi:hypothetical protein